MITYNEPWTMEVTARFLELLRIVPNTMQTIADQLNAEFGLKLSRSAISGRLNRLGLRMPKQPDDETPPTVEITCVEVKPDQFHIEMRPRRPPRPRKPKPPPPPGKLTIYDLTGTTCRWPMSEIDDMPPYLYCGHRSLDGLPYCSEHCARAYTAPHMRWE
jgi:GcrA cell cycle regulator